MSMDAFFSLLIKIFAMQKFVRNDRGLVVLTHRNTQTNGRIQDIDRNWCKWKQLIHFRTKHRYVNGQSHMYHHHRILLTAKIVLCIHDMFYNNNGFWYLLHLFSMWWITFNTYAIRTAHTNTYQTLQFDTFGLFTPFLQLFPFSI